MSPTRRHRTTTSAAAVLAAFALALTACGSDSEGESKGKGGGAESGTSAEGARKGEDAVAIPETANDLPDSLKELKEYDWDSWGDWAKQQAFTNPKLAALWTPQRMAGAKDPQNTVPKDAGKTAPATDPAPGIKLAGKVQRPYSESENAGVGKVFFDGPGGSYVCSAAVVQDPAHPGKSNLVWTAGHCVHGGKGKSWYRNVQFVPSYNDSGTATAGEQAKVDDKIAPFGMWWAENVGTSKSWTQDGGENGEGAPYDYAVLKVAPPKGAKSLEETVGQAYPVWFGAPEKLKTVTAGGYPAGPPYEGRQMYTCTSAAARMSVDKDAPNLKRIGCTMTGGSSGGPWFAENPDGETALVSNTSIGPALLPLWLAGPSLGDNAEQLLAGMAKQ